MQLGWAIATLYSLYTTWPTGYATSSDVATMPTPPPGVPATTFAWKNPTNQIMYDDYNHEPFPVGDPSKRAFTYFVLTGGRFVYAAAIRLAVLKFVLSMSVRS